MAVTATVEPVSSYSRLAEGTGPWANEMACLGVRFPATGCRACEAVCPVSVLQVTPHGLELADGCTGCGRCAASCPTRALSIPGFLTEVPDDGEEILEVDCAKVPGAGGLAGGLRVPCLGGLSRSQLIALVKLNPERKVLLMDRGWCDQCTSGGRPHPAQAQVSDVNRWLSAIGVPESRHIRHVSRPLPLRHMPEDIPDPTASRPMDRRGFLRQLAGQLAMAAQGPEDGHDQAGEPPTPDGSRRIHPAERVAILTQLRDLAADGNPGLPVELLYRVEIDDGRCRHHALCASTCPTAALSAWAAGDEHGVQFDPATCIGCGECERNCPERALRLQNSECPTEPFRIRILSRHGTRTCARCRRDFAAPKAGHDAADSSLCPACAKDRTLMTSTFEHLFGRTQRSADPQQP